MSRSDREAQFHDDRFAVDGGRRAAGRFYRVTGPSRDDFERRIADVDDGARVLELGCGPDSMAWGLIDAGVDVTGIDISEAAVELARSAAVERGADPAAFSVMNAEALQFADDSFEVVVGPSILHHLDLPVALDEIRRVLGPGGRAVFYEPWGHNPLINLYRRLTPDQRSADERPLSTEDVELIESVFDSVDVTAYHLSSLAALALLGTRAFDPVAERLERLDRAAMAKIPALQRFAWVAVIEARTAQH